MSISNEQAIYILRNMAFLSGKEDAEKTEEAIGMAIEALSCSGKSNNSDTIYRQDVYNLIDNWSEDMIAPDAFRCDVEDLPSAQQLDNNSTKVDNEIVDLISRQDVLNIVLLEPGITDWQFKMIENLPSAEPERKKRKWIRKAADGVYWFECEKCGARPLLNAWHKGDELSEFCPRCGAWLQSNMKGEG